MCSRIPGGATSVVRSIVLLARSGSLLRRDILTPNSPFPRTLAPDLAISGALPGLDPRLIGLGFFYLAVEETRVSVDGEKGNGNMNTPSLPPSAFLSAPPPAVFTRIASLIRQLRLSEYSS